MTAEVPRLALVIAIHFGDTSPTINLLKSLSRLDQFSDLSISIVNNGPDESGRSTLATATRSMPNISVVNSVVNRGYFGGARHGLAHYLESHPLPDWVIISNIDLLITDHRFLSRLAAIDGGSGLGVVAPCIRSSKTGRDQNPFIERRPSVARMHAYKWIYRSRLALHTYELAAAAFHKTHGFFMPQRQDAESTASTGRTIYAPHGSFLIFAKEYFRAGGTLDFPCFLFGEEIYVAETVRRLGLKVRYEPSLVVTHQEHATTKLVKSQKLAEAVAVSAAYCANTYFPWN